MFGQGGAYESPGGTGGGEGGIRTPGGLLDLGALAKLCFQPLSHLTGEAVETSAILFPQIKAKKSRSIPRWISRRAKAILEQ